jgi:protein-S-isoprenylcysteine O-methyltransferase Ste14
MMLLLIKNLGFTILVPGTVAVYLPLRLVGSRFELLTGAWGIVQATALLPLAIGAAIYFWCLWDFAVHGRGTPAPIDAPRNLVARGLYGYTRNPMYIGVLLVIVGWSVFFRSWPLLLYAVAVGLLFHLFVRLVEEPILRKKFGESYLSYCRRVRRWLPNLKSKQTV